jgi:hypothetical protein
MEHFEQDIDTDKTLQQTLRSPLVARRNADRLAGIREQLLRDRKSKSEELDEYSAYLQIAGKVSVALEVLSQKLFQRVLSVIEENLTIALQEVLEQPIQLKTSPDWKRGGATVKFWIERDGNPEDIMKGQGGSVTNVLSVGLRMFALTTLDESVHRRFLVLDEQDCWIRPTLVPRLVKVVRAAGKTLGFQVIMISHHDISAFEHYADRVYQFRPVGNDVEVRQFFRGPLQEDAEPLPTSELE